MTDANETPVAETVQPRTDAVFAFLKRVIDVTVVLVSFVLLAPVFLAVSVAIKATSPGPILFRNTVIGKNGKPFTYYKFRSMRTDMDDSEHREFIQRYVREGRGHVDAQAGEEVFKLTNDPRVTAVGRTIRRLSIDEFPQMINVLKGDMSLVGPRPPVEYEYELYDDAMKQRLLVKPGITGLNQVRARSQSSFEQMYADDLEYIEKQSTWLDLKIIFQTPWVMLFGKGPT